MRNLAPASDRRAAVFLWFTEDEFRRPDLTRPGPLRSTYAAGKRTGRSRGHGRFGAFPCCEGSRPWNSQISYLSALIAAQNSSLLRASSSSFTIKISRTTPSAANSARPNAPTGVPESGPKPEPSVRRAEPIPRFRFVPRRGVPYCADPAFRRCSRSCRRLRRRRRLERRLDQHETGRLSGL